MKIATLGPQGTYSGQAAVLFAKRMGIASDEFEICFTSVLSSLRMVRDLKVDYALVPIENMIDGLIGSTFDALIEYHDFVKVCDEIHLPISHVLAASPQAQWQNLQKIYSHPSALNQCQNRLEELFPHVEVVAVASTAEAAEKILMDSEGSSAAICSELMARNNQLQVYHASIQDYEYNETRFLVCALTDGQPTINDRTLLAIRYGQNKPGQLFQTTKYLADYHIDLTCVQSRPYKIKPQEYVLIYELVGHRSEEGIEAALKQIELQIRLTNGWKKILGSFPKREKEVVDAAVTGSVK